MATSILLRSLDRLETRRSFRLGAIATCVVFLSSLCVLQARARADSRMPPSQLDPAQTNSYLRSDSNVLEIAPTAPATDQTNSRMLDADRSEWLTKYLQQRRLPYVTARVRTGSDGSTKVVLSGFVATSFGKAGAVEKARRFFDDSQISIDNQIKVSPDLAQSYHQGESSWLKVASEPMGSSKDGESRELTRYLNSHRLPYVSAQVVHGPRAVDRVILTGCVATQFGKDDAARKAEDFHGHCRIDNRIVVQPNLRVVNRSLREDPVDGDSMNMRFSHVQDFQSNETQTHANKADPARPACPIVCYLTAASEHPLAARLFPVPVFMLRYCSLLTDVAGP